MIKPTPGRVVWFYPARSEAMSTNGDQPLAAIVACVWTDRCVNLAIFDASGVAHQRTSVTLVQEGDAIPAYSYCSWMPYQQAQAKKAE